MSTTRSCDYWTAENSDVKLQITQILHNVMTLEQRLEAEPIEPPSLHTEVMLEHRVHFLTGMLFRIKDAIDAVTAGLCAAVLSACCAAHAMTQETDFLVAGWISFMSILGLWMAARIYVNFQLRKL